MQKPSIALKPLVLAALLCAGGAARADITVYTSQADFLAAVSAPGYDSYDDLVVAPYPATLDRSAGAYGYQAYSEAGLWGAGGAGGDYWLSSENRTQPILFSGFTGGVSAFGGNFFTSDIAGQYLSGNLILTAYDGTSLTYTLDGTTPDTFLGFVSDTALRSVTLENDGGAYWPTANNVVLAVPEPATYGMLLAGTGLLGVAARRRRG
ncbi:PEP-CTERM sorting domain-containing protein [uncultured Massilia sp.]|uniref:PEP-CTERM sorting domain-containing protein n=1 Tax=uncultured Massilia sp. TaxID=169973 RepID=UPI0025D7A078|nr:PEP-CTERM sorting domain-containing protein [uncultured Massilia sp.]